MPGLASPVPSATDKPHLPLDSQPPCTSAPASAGAGAWPVVASVLFQIVLPYTYVYPGNAKPKANCSSISSGLFHIVVLVVIVLPLILVATVVIRIRTRRLRNKL